MSKKKSSIENIRPPCDLRARIYEEHLRKAHEELLNASKRADRKRFRDALHDRELLDMLAKLLDEYVIVGVAADLNRCRSWLKNPHRLNPSGDDLDNIIDRSKQPRWIESDDPDRIGKKDREKAYKLYFEWLIIPEKVRQSGEVRTGIEAFFERNPMIKHAVDRISHNFVSNITSACERICADWDTISTVFFDNDTRPAKLVKIIPTGSDFHKGGRQVLVLNFLCKNGSKRKLVQLVYKPADVELDYRFVGDTEAIRKVFRGDPLASSQSLAELLNGHLDSDFRLPTYRILPRNPGSSLNWERRKEAKRLPIENSYGYIEYLTNKPEAKWIEQLPADWDTSGPSDWVTSNEADVCAFYRQWGCLLAIASVFSLSDIHVENIIVHELRPHLIDLEISFTGPMLGVKGTLAFGALKDMGFDVYERVRFDDLTANLFVKDDERGKKDPERGKNRIVYWANESKSMPIVANPADWTQPLYRGLYETLEVFADNQEEFIGWLVGTKKAVARFTPYPTGEFKKRLDLVYSPKYCSDAPNDFNRDPYLCWRSYAENAYRLSRDIPGESKPVQWPGPRPNYAIQTPKHNFTDYLNCDVPAYYHRLDSLDLLNARGEKVAVKEDKLANRDTYFPRPRSNYEIVKKQLSDLNDPKKRMERLHSICQDLLVAFSPVQPTKDTSNPSDRANTEC